METNPEVEECFVEASLNWSWLTKQDLVEVAQLQSAVDYFDDPIEQVGLTEFQAWFDAFPNSALIGAACGRDKFVGDVVAYGWNVPINPDGLQPRVNIYGAVHPGWRDQRIGHKLVAWQEEMAIRWATKLTPAPPSVWLGTYAPGEDTRRRRLFESIGFAPERYFFDMHHQFSRVPDPPPPPPVPGIEFRVYTTADEEPVRQLHNLCFNQSSGFIQVSREQWHRTQTRPGARPELSWLAFAGDQLVGYALNSADESAWAQLGFSEGWTDRLGVHPRFRRRGIAKGLLSWSMWSFGRAGFEGAGLGIDTSDQSAAESLYQGLGYESTNVVVLLSKTDPLA